MSENPVSRLSTVLAPSMPVNQGRTGLRRQQNLSPVYEEFLPQLSPGRRAQVYHEIASNSAIVGASLHAIRSLLRRAPLIVKPAGDKPRHLRAADIVREALPPILIRSFVDTASAAMLVYGYSLNAMHLTKLPSGVWGFERLPPRSPRSIQEWLWDETYDRPWAAVQTAWAEGMQNTALPLDLMLHCRTSAGPADDPEGASPLRHCYSASYYAKRLGELEAIGIERDLVGLPVLKVPGEMLDPQATPEQKAALTTFQNLLKDIRRDTSEGVILPSDRDDKGDPFFEVSLLSVGANRQTNTGQVVERYERRIAQAFLTDFLFLGQGASGAASAGSYALADSKTGLFTLSLQALHDTLTDELSLKALPMIGMMNGIPQDLWPTLEFGDIEPLDAEALSNYIQKLSTAGLEFTDRETQDALREQVDLPLLPDDWQPPPSRAEQAAQAQANTERQMQQAADAAAQKPAPADKSAEKLIRLLKGLG